MKTSTVIVLVVVLYLVANGGLFSPASAAVAPAARPAQPQSGGGDSVNAVLALITAGANAVGKGLDLASDRGAPSGGN